MEPICSGNVKIKASWEGDEVYEGAESTSLIIHVSSISETSSPTTSLTTSPTSEATEATQTTTPSPLSNIIVYAAIAGAIATIVIAVLLMMKRAKG